MTANSIRRFVTHLTGFLALLMLVCMLLPGVFALAADTGSSDNRRLQNGSFEEGMTFTNPSNQKGEHEVPYWRTTACGKKIELFTENKGTYFTNVTLKPAHGNYAAELNADEESTLFQVVNTAPSSIYEWGLSHGSRGKVDVMALVIGPAQPYAPSKPEKNGRDQLMQMVDWLGVNGNTVTPGAVPQQYVVYSKKFAPNGTFADNAGNNPFSRTPSTIYTEEWHIWVMASRSATSGVNPWNRFGMNGIGAAASEAEKELSLSEYYFYTVPAGQTQTLFCFTSISSGSNNKTLGNFIDVIDFKLYHPLSGSSTAHGSATISNSSDGEAALEGTTIGHPITINGSSSHTSHIPDGYSLIIKAIITAEDLAAGCDFVGVYHTSQDNNGNRVTNFIRGDAEGWTASDAEDGSRVYTYILNGVNSATDLHFVFIKSPTITYDANGGQDYVVDRTYNTAEAPNVYSFKPAVSGSDTTFISPYVSHAASGLSEGWKFVGWLLTGDAPGSTASPVINSDSLGNNTQLLPAVHTIACDYILDKASTTDSSQYFKVFEGSQALTSSVQTNEIGEAASVTWQNDSAMPLYGNAHKGLTMVAQWRWSQTFRPQTNSTNGYINSASGGSVTITSNREEQHYNTLDNGGICYYAATDEMITVSAQAAPGHTFEGWYNEAGQLVTTNPVYGYTETKESIRTLYARFSGNITQTFIRQVSSGSSWTDTTDDTVATLGRYTYTDVVGTRVSSTAAAGTEYRFVGWYDAAGTQVTANTTLEYTTSVSAVYYARFEQKNYTVSFVSQTKQPDGSFVSNTDGGIITVSSRSGSFGTEAASQALTSAGATFMGWFDASGNQLSTETVYSVTLSSNVNNNVYYARFEFVYHPEITSGPYLSFVAESSETIIPDVFAGRQAGTGINAKGFGGKYGNTISTGFKYKLDNLVNVTSVQITVTVPANAWVREYVGGPFTGIGSPVVTDSEKTTYHKGSIRQINEPCTLTYHWPAQGLQAGVEYGFILDNLYAPGASAVITVNQTNGFGVTAANGVVNTASANYRTSSHYPK